MKCGILEGNHANTDTIRNNVLDLDGKPRFWIKLYYEQDCLLCVKIKYWNCFRKYLFEMGK